jgi:ribulose-phosphate 3-epimerase
MKVKIAPSLLSADFCCLGEEIKKVEKWADMLHIDVMDGHFVPNITIGPGVVKDIRKITSLPLDVHLMIENPENYIEKFAQAGADIITIHQESAKKPGELLKKIRGMGKKAGISIKPKTPVSAIKKFVNDADMVLVMTVEPGFGGQALIEGTPGKIKEVREIFDGDLEVDGGINRGTIRSVIEKGANVIVAGSAIFGAKDPGKEVQELRKIAHGKV